MKKTLIVLLTAVLAISMLFVSCSNETKLDERVNVSFGVSQGRSLTSSASFADFNDFDWWYKATTATTSSPFNYGATNGWEKLANGLKTQLEFSQGIWNFELCAVESGTTKENVDAATKAYYGSRSSVLIEKSNNGSVVTIAISVTPGSTGKGTIFISKDIIVNKRNGETSTIVANNYDIKKKDSSTKFTGVINGSAVSQEVDAGSYTVTIYYKEIYAGATEGYILRATEPIDVTVYDSSTITVEGSIDESTQAIIINPVNKYKVEGSTTVTKTGVEFQDVAVTAPMTPAMSSSASDNTVVTVPGSIISAKAGEEETSATVKVAVEVTPVTEASVNDAFKISSTNNTAAAAIDLTLYVNGSAVTEYSEAENAPLLTVETYVARNLSNPKVTYNGAIISENPEYNPNTGYLKFTTTHFSTFVVETSSKALINDRAYDNISNAVNASKNGDVITLIANASMESSLEINGGKQITINLNGFDISAPDKVIIINNANVTLTGPGTVYESSNDQHGAIYLKGSSEKTASNYSVVTVDKNVTLRGWSGIFVPAPTAKDSETNKGNNYGVVANVKGKIVLPGMDSHTTRNGGGIYINGANDSNVGNVPVFNLDGADITGNGGIYAAGYAKWNIIGDTKISGDEFAIEIRAGELNISDGEFKASSSPAGSVSNGSGSTTHGTAIAVSQHSTKLPINVNISGGTFEGYSAFYESNPQNNSANEIALVELSITGGTFNAINGGTCAVYSQDKVGFITGGTFSSHPSKYVAKGYEVKEDGGKFVVSLKSGAKTEHNTVIPADAEVINDQRILEQRLSSAVTGETKTLYIGEGTFDINKVDCDGKTIMFVGSGYDKTTLLYGTKPVSEKGEAGSCYSFEGANVTFKDVTLQDLNGDDVNYEGFVRSNSLTFENCLLKSRMTYLGEGETVSFTNCTFNTPKYAAWIYSTQTYNFDNCLFESKTGRFLNIYGDDNDIEPVINATECMFIDTSDGMDSNAVFNIKSRAKTTLTIQDCVVTGASPMYNVAASNGTTVTVDETVVYPITN